MMGEAFGLPLAQMMRTHCDECGSSDLAWLTALDLLQAAKSPDLKQHLRDIVGIVGGDAESWSCRTCLVGFGIFGPTHFDDA